MITENNFSKDWVYSICDLLKRGKNQADPELVEKVINALYLLESIKKATHKYHGDIIINLETAVSKSKDLIQMRRSSSYSNRIHEEQELIDASIQKTIELLKTHGSGV